MADLVSVPTPRLDVSQAPRSDVSSAAFTRPNIGAGLEQLGAGAGDLAASLAKTQAQSDVAKTEITLDPAGNVQVANPSNSVIVGQAGEDYNRVLADGLYAKTQASVTQGLTSVQLAHQDDPAAAKVAFDQYVGAVRQSATTQLGAQVGNALADRAQNEAVQRWGNIAEKNAEINTRASQAAIETRIDDANNWLTAAARQGAVDTDAYREKQADLSDAYDALGTNKLYGYSPDRIESMKNRSIDNLNGEYVVGQIDDTFTKKGKNAALEAVRTSIDNNPDLDISDADRNHLHNLAMSRLAYLTDDQQSNIAALKPTVEMQVAKLRAGNGGPDAVSDRELDQTTTQLQSLGAFKEAQDLQAARIVSDRMGAFKNLSPDQKSTVLLGASSAGVGGPVASALNSEQGGLQYFISQGWTPAQAAGIMGNLVHESGGRLNAAAVNRGDGSDGSDSIGIGQWNSDRSGALKAFAAAQGKPWQDYQTQLGFVQHELQGSEGSAAQKLRAAQTPQDAASAFALGYERPQGFQTGDLSKVAGGQNRLDQTMRIAGGGASNASVAGATGVATAGQPFTDAEAAANPWLRTEYRAQLQVNDATQVRYAKTTMDTLDSAIKFTGNPSPDMIPTAAAALQIADRFPDQLGEQATKLRGALAGAKAGFGAASSPDGGTGLLEQANDLARTGNPFGLALAQNVKSGLDAGKKLLADDQFEYGHQAEWLPRKPAPLDFSDPVKLQQSVAEHAVATTKIAAQLGRPSMSAFTPAETGQIKNVMEGAPVDGRLALLGAITSANMPQPILEATLKGLGSDDATRPLAVAGDVARYNPVVARGILQGQALMQTDKDLAPNKDDFPTAFANALPFNDLGGDARKGYDSAIQALYAQRSAAVSDTAGVLNQGRLDDVIRDVTGGVVEWRGGKAIAPWYGASQGQFEAALGAVTDKDLAGSRGVRRHPAPRICLEAVGRRRLQRRLALEAAVLRARQVHGLLGTRRWPAVSAGHDRQGLRSRSRGQARPGRGRFARDAVEPVLPAELTLVRRAGTFGAKQLMLDYSTDQADLQSPLSGPAPRVAPPTMSEAYTAANEANDRINGVQAAYRNQQDYLQQRTAAFTAKTGVDLPKLQITADPDSDLDDYDTTFRGWLGGVRATMTAQAKSRNDPSLLPPSDQDIAAGGLQIARSAAQREADLSRGPGGAGMLLGSTAASLYGSVTDPYNAISAAALTLAPEGAPLLAAALRTAAAMGGQQLIEDAARYRYRQQVDPTYGPGAVVSDVAEAAAGGALFGAGHALGGEGLRGTLGAAVGGAVGGGGLGYLQGGAPGAVEGAIGGAALPLAGAGFGMTSRVLGASWRALVAARPELAASMPLDVRDAGVVAEKAGDLDAQNPFSGPSGAAAHGEAIAKIEADLIGGRSPELPPSAEAEAQVRRGQVFFPGGAIEARYGVAEHADLITSHDADFNVRPDYPPELQPRDRGGAPARDQVTNMAANLEPERLGPSPEANSGAPIVGPDGVVESGNGRTLAVGRAYDMGRGDDYRQWLEGQGYDTTGFDKPILVGMRETPLDDRAAFAHAANGSASLRMSATEQALSDARLIDGSTLDLHAAPDLAAASNRDFARAMVAKLPAGERGGMLTRDGGLSAGGAARMRGALTARAYGDPAFLTRALDHPDPNIKAIAGALGDAAGPWARMRDVATRGDIEPGHDITRDVLQAVHAIMRARDEGRPPWEMLNQGDIFQSDTTQLAARMFFRDEEMRQPAGRARVAEALSSYAEEAAKNTKAGRLFADDVGVGDVLRRVVSKIMPDASDDFVLAMVRKAEAGGGWLGDMMREMISGEPAERPAEPPIAMEETLEEQLRKLIAGVEREQPKGETFDLAREMRKLIGSAGEPSPEPGHTVYKPGEITFADHAPKGAYEESDSYEHDWGREGLLYHSMSFAKDGDRINGIVHDLRDEHGYELETPLSRVETHKLKKSLMGHLEDQAEQETEGDRWDSLTEQQQQAEIDARETAQQTADRANVDDINGKVDALVASGLRPRIGDIGTARAPEPIRFFSPKNVDIVKARLRFHGVGDDSLASLRRSPEEIGRAADQAAQDVTAMARRPEPAEGEAPETPGEAAAKPDLELRNPKTGATVAAQDVTPFRDMLKRFDVSRDLDADPLQRAMHMAVGKKLGDAIGDMKVYTVGPAEMRALMDQRLKGGISPGYEPAGFFDPTTGHIAVLDDALRDPRDASQLLVHEGLHGALQRTIDGSDSAKRIVDYLRETALATHFERGGEAADHYGLKNAHEFVSEANSNTEFQRFLSSIPADDRLVQAMGLDKQPGTSLWDVFVGAVRKILGLAPDQHSLLDASMRMTDLLFKQREGGRARRGRRARAGPASR